MSQLREKRIRPSISPFMAASTKPMYCSDECKRNGGSPVIYIVSPDDPRIAELTASGALRVRGDPRANTPAPRHSAPSPPATPRRDRLLVLSMAHQEASNFAGCDVSKFDDYEDEGIANPQGQ